MICPMMSRQVESCVEIHCAKEECAWWIKTADSCAIKTLAENSDYVGEMAIGSRTLYVREV